MRGHPTHHLIFGDYVACRSLNLVYFSSSVSMKVSRLCECALLARDISRNPVMIEVVAIIDFPFRHRAIFPFFTQGGLGVCRPYSPYWVQLNNRMTLRGVMPVAMTIGASLASLGNCPISFTVNETLQSGHMQCLDTRKPTRTQLCSVIKIGLNRPCIIHHRVCIPIEGKSGSLRTAGAVIAGSSMLA